MYPSVLHVPTDEADATAEPIPVVRQGRMPGTVAVVSVGSALTHRGLAGGAGSVEPVLRHWAALIHQCTGLAARPVYLAAGNAEDLSTGPWGLPCDIESVFLIHTDPAHHPRPPGLNRVVIAGAAPRPAHSAPTVGRQA
ncbi:MAG: hypothetical protein ACRDS0_04960 [Pseudonocardiaceae bacterium]